MLSERKLRHSLHQDSSKFSKLASSTADLASHTKRTSQTASPFKGRYFDESHKQINLVRDHNLKSNVLRETYRMDVKLNRHKSVFKIKDSVMSSYDFELMKFKRPIIPKTHKAKQPRSKVSPSKSTKLRRSKTFISSANYLKVLNEKLEGNIIDQNAVFTQSR